MYRDLIAKCCHLAFQDKKKSNANIQNTEIKIERITLHFLRNTKTPSNSRKEKKRPLTQRSIVDHNL